MQLCIAINEFEVEVRAYAGNLIPERLYSRNDAEHTTGPKMIITSRNLIEKFFALVTLVIHD